jgi:cell division protein FtsB
VFSYSAVLQNKVNANEELMALEQEEAQLKADIKEDEDGWRVDEY